MVALSLAYRTLGLVTGSTIDTPEKLGNTIRWCRKCQKDTDRSAKSGVCVPCARANSAAQYQKRKSRTDEIRWCSRCQADTRRYGSGNCAPCARALFEKKRASGVSWYQRNRDRVTVYRKRYKQQNEKRIKAKAREWRVRPSVRARQFVQTILREHGQVVSYDEVLAALLRNDGTCDCCGQVPQVKSRGLHIDHCHESLRIRGVICYGCNAAEGMLGSDPARARALLAYMEKHGAGRPQHDLWLTEDCLL